MDCLELIQDYEYSRWTKIIDETFDKKGFKERNKNKIQTPVKVLNINLTAC